MFAFFSFHHTPVDVVFRMKRLGCAVVSKAQNDVKMAFSSSQMLGCCPVFVHFLNKVQHNNTPQAFIHSLSLENCSPSECCKSPNYRKERPNALEFWNCNKLTNNKLRFQRVLLSGNTINKCRVLASKCQSPCHRSFDGAPRNSGQ